MFNAIQRGPNQEYDVYVCLSTDVKKTDGIHNGDMLIEIDTSAMYIFDAVSSTWKALNSGGGGGTDVSDTTAIAADVLAGKDFYLADGTKTSGTIQAKAAQTYTPGTTAQTIAAGQYLSGAQTIAGDANLIAANILQGVSIFGVAGEASGGVISMDIGTAQAKNGALSSSFLAAHELVVGLALMGYRDSDVPSVGNSVSAFVVFEGDIIQNGTTTDVNGQEYKGGDFLKMGDSQTIVNDLGYLIDGEYILFGFDVV